MTLNDQFDQFKAQNKRTGHNLGFTRKFTSAPGMILPIDHRIMSPSETIEWSVKMNTISQPLLRPAFLDVVQKVDCFFVPLSMIFTAFPNVFFQTSDLLTSAISPDDPWPNLALPLTSYFDIRLSNVGEFSTKRLSSFNEINTQLNENFDSDMFGAYRLGMMLGLNPNTLFFDLNVPAPVGVSSRMSYRFFPYQLAAYQAIYQNWYRDDDREERVLSSYQLDYLTNTSLGTTARGDLFRLRYHQRERDYFSSLRVSPIMSTLNMLNENSLEELSKVNNYLSAENIKPADNEGSYNFNNKNFDQFMGDDAMFATGSLRSLFAVEKFNRIMGRARKNYDSQVMAHFGFDVPRDIKHEISFLGSFSGNVGVDTVVSSAATEQAELGERAGTAKGVLDGKPIKFTAPCHGVFIAVYYGVPRFSYPEGFFFDKKNKITERLDFPIPEYDRLGDQPLYGYESLVNPYFDDPTSTGTAAAAYNHSLGWQRRYEQYKRNYSRHSLAFYRPTTDEGVNVWSPWVLGALPYDSFDIDSVDDPLNPGHSSEYSDITPRYDSLLVAPNCLNDLFLMKYKTTTFTGDEIFHPWTLFQRDPFMHAATINCKLVSFMSVTGEPSLDSMF